MSHNDRHFDRLNPLAEHPSPLLFEKQRDALLRGGDPRRDRGHLRRLVGGSQFYFSWLSGWAFCWSLMMGILFFVMLHYLVDAGWDTVIRRPAEQVLSTMPVIVLGMVPIVIGMLSGKLYGWVHPEAAHPLHGFKATFLSLPAAADDSGHLRGDLAVAGVCAAAELDPPRCRWGRPLDGLQPEVVGRGDPALCAVADGRLAGAPDVAGLSLVQHHVQGLYLVRRRGRGPGADVAIGVGGCGRACCGSIGSDTLHDIGKLTFAFNCFWAYIAFSQYFLIWYGNIPEETVWFLNRWNGTEGPATWWILGLIFPVGMFVLPFLLLMSATMKRNARMLGTMCAIMLLCHFLEIYWIVQPEAGAHGARALHPPLEWLWIDLSVVLLLGGLCGVMFISNFRKAMHCR